ncbi:MAG: class I SAM-dependent methyltransferase, partial [Planctomycetes bacterium]|nr:class I SAM-dependent methyltransferase [Planctomycetota bacterium]
AEILECGTGVSTVVMAAALRDNEREDGKPGRITSMEDGADWFEHAKEIFPRELEPYVDIVFSPQTQYRERFFCGVGYQSIPRRRYQLAFIDGPDDRLSPADAPTVDLDYIRLLRMSADPVLGVIDGRLATCLVYQSLLGLDKVRFEPALGLTFVGPCSRKDLETPQLAIGWGRRTNRGFYTL